MAELLFHGAAGEVTGSHHLLNARGKWIALDCGLFHGRRAEAEQKNREWAVAPKELAAVVLSHAHIDHSGRLPRLVKDGFAGPIFCTPATRDLCAIMLPDSAHIQEEDEHYVNKRRRKKGLEPIEALYRYDDALATIRNIQTVSYGRWFHVVDGVEVRFNEAGHMLGSAGVEVRIKGAPQLYFTGDIGRPDKPIIRDPANFPEADVVICESTYGDRLHETVQDAETLLVETVARTVKRGGKVIIPAFSVGRTQSIVYFLQQAMATGELPQTRVFVDSPLSVNATEIFRMHPECYDAEARAFHRVTRDILGGSHLTYVRDVEESKALQFRDKPCVIISASGMCENGRIRHHIKNNVRMKKNTILIPGFQAAHTLGRRLVEGAKKINLFNESYDVSCEVVQLNGFSGHADQQEMADLLQPLAARAKHVYLVHGETDQSAPFAAKLQQNGFPKVTVAERGMAAKL